MDHFFLCALKMEWWDKGTKPQQMSVTNISIGRALAHVVAYTGDPVTVKNERLFNRSLVTIVAAPYGKQRMGTQAQPTLPY